MSGDLTHLSSAFCRVPSCGSAIGCASACAAQRRRARKNGLNASPTAWGPNNSASFFLPFELYLAIMREGTKLAPTEGRRRPITIQQRLRDPSDRDSLPLQVGVSHPLFSAVVFSATAFRWSSEGWRAILRGAFFRAPCVTADYLGVDDEVSELQGGGVAMDDPVL